MGKLNVSGTGTIKAPPDVADVTFTVTKEAPRCGAAINEVNGIVTKLHEIVLNDFSVAKKDIQTSAVGSNPKWTSVPAKISGYLAWNSTTVRLRDVSRLGELLSALTDGGATSLGQAWDIDNKQDFEDAARILAFADAKRKGDLYAREAKLRLGALDELTENQRWSYRAPGAGMARPGAGMARQDVTMSAVMENAPIESGEQTVTITVQVVYDI